MFTTSQPNFSKQGFYGNANPAFRAASWGNAANFGRTQSQQQQNLWGQQQQARSAYSISNRQFQNDQSQNSRNQRDQFLRFGVGALSGLMRR